MLITGALGVPPPSFLPSTFPIVPYPLSSLSTFTGEGKTVVWRWPAPGSDPAPAPAPAPSAGPAPRPVAWSRRKEGREEGGGGRSPVGLVDFRTGGVAGTGGTFTTEARSSRAHSGEKV
jgi:hypothetical protein